MSRGLTLDQLALAIGAPPIAGERSVVAHDPMARDGDGDGVRRACLRHRARRISTADAFGDLRVAHGRADWDRPQRLPDALLEGGSVAVEREIESARRGLDEVDDLR